MIEGAAKAEKQEGLHKQKTWQQQHRKATKGIQSQESGRTYSGFHMWTRTTSHVSQSSQPLKRDGRESSFASETKRMSCSLNCACAHELIRVTISEMQVLCLIEELTQAEGRQTWSSKAHCQIHTELGDFLHAHESTQLSWQRLSTGFQSLYICTAKMIGHPWIGRFW